MLIFDITNSIFHFLDSSAHTKHQKEKEDEEEEEAYEVNNGEDKTEASIADSEYHSCRCSNGIEDNEQDIQEKMEQLKAFESRLLALQQHLNEQKALFEMQRLKEISHIQKEKENLVEMEKQAELDHFIEKEVQRRLRDHQLNCEKNWREELESRANDYLRITTSSPTMTGDEVEAEEEEHIFIKIPSYKWIEKKFDSHFEYNIFFIIKGMKLTIQRRYRQFREFHLWLDRSYGSRVDVFLPYFPPRKMFWTKSLTSLAEERRKGLEKYLRKVLPMLMRLHDSPISCKGLTPTKFYSQLFTFSPFFKDDIPDIEELS